MKMCISCDTNKPLTEFYTDFTREVRCKSCVSILRRDSYKKNKEVVIKRVKEYRNKNPEKIRDTKLKQAYGVGVDYFNEKLKEQDGVCAGCKRNVKIIWRGKVVRMALDHDHNTGNPRGVLCIKCNRALGLLEENENIFYNLLEYINKYKKVG